MFNNFIFLIRVGEQIITKKLGKIKTTLLYILFQTMFGSKKFEGKFKGKK